ncbi:hypothetical protein LWI29_037728 [Acer saccharum]|uniref:Uncharacterized protein n=1 Tax=Acer saccharum TaxID=4024 RepID=A0AA39VCT9_ACESA|nr:hypothetical protein LWI29_037728 [Acer saccharum]
MIKRPFVFVVMEFDQVSPNPWDTDYQAIVRKYTEKGYGLAVPKATLVLISSSTWFPTLRLGVSSTACALPGTTTPLTTLKLIFNLRGVRGTGKSDMDGFYMAALWLHQNHPKTLAANVGSIPRFGYLKDLPEILYQLPRTGHEEEAKSRVGQKEKEHKRS